MKEFCDGRWETEQGRQTEKKRESERSSEFQHTRDLINARPNKGLVVSSRVEKLDLPLLLHARHSTLSTASHLRNTFTTILDARSESSVTTSRPLRYQLPRHWCNRDSSSTPSDIYPTYRWLAHLPGQQTQIRAWERVRWVSAIWWVPSVYLKARNHLTRISRVVLNRSVTSLSDRSVTRSPTGSIRTIGSIDSSTSMRSGSGSASTVFVPPLDSIADIDDLQSRLDPASSLLFFAHLRLLQLITLELRMTRLSQIKAIYTPEILT
jgi:hypothetical protein